MIVTGSRFATSLAVLVHAREAMLVAASALDEPLVLLVLDDDVAGAQPRTRWHGSYIPAPRSESPGRSRSRRNLRRSLSSRYVDHNVDDSRYSRHSRHSWRKRQGVSASTPAKFSGPPSLLSSHMRVVVTLRLSTARHWLAIRVCRRARAHKRHNSISDRNL